MPPTAPRPILPIEMGPPGADLPLSLRNFNVIRKLALEKAGITLADHKRNMVYRRLTRRVASLGFADFDDYCALLSGPEGEGEMQHMINALTTNKTDFFRENHHFDHLAATAIPAMMNSGAAQAKRLRIWSAGCSSGQEPYSIAMTLLRAVPDLDRFDARILATDIDTEILARAERGIYAAHELAAIPHGLRNVFFQAAPGHPNQFRALAALRGLVAFRPLNLHNAWPMKGPFDAVFCRNVVIYFDKTAQTRLFDRFANILVPGGFLYIGHSESLFRVTERFRAIGQSIYRKIA